MTTYVARFTETPKNDIERGWSGFMAEFYETIEEALYGIGADFLNLDDELEEAQRRWVNSYGEQYEDFDVFYQAYLEELAEDSNLRQDPHSGAWRPFHHEGLSCYELSATNENEAILEAQTRQDLEWAGFGQKTHGKVEYVCPVEGVENLHIFKCEYTTYEA